LSVAAEMCARYSTALLTILAQPRTYVGENVLAQPWRSHRNMNRVCRLVYSVYDMTMCVIMV